MAKFVAFSIGDEAEVSDFTALCFEGEVADVLNCLASVDWKAEGTRPLEWAIKGYRSDRKPIITSLIQSGSPVSGQALYLAGRFHPNLLSILPDPNLFERSNGRAIDSALLDASRSGRAADILRFIGLGANPEAGDYYHGKGGWNSLHLVCERCDWPAFQALMSVYVDIHRLTNDGQTALMVLNASAACQKNPHDALKIRDRLEGMAKSYPK